MHLPTCAVPYLEIHARASVGDVLEPAQKIAGAVPVPEDAQRSQILHSCRFHTWLLPRHCV